MVANYPTSSAAKRCTLDYIVRGLLGATVALLTIVTLWRYEFMVNVMDNGATSAKFFISERLMNKASSETELAVMDDIRSHGTAVGFDEKKDRPPLPQLDPFAPAFAKHLSFRGNPVVKCDGDRIRVEPWLRVVNGSKILFSVPDDVKKQFDYVTCSVKELKVWPKEPGAHNGKPSFWEAKNISLALKYGSPNDQNDGLTIAAGKQHSEDPKMMTTTLHLEKSDFAIADCSAAVLHSENLTVSWSGILTGIHRSNKFDEDKTLSKAQSSRHDGMEDPLNVFMFVLDTVSRYTAENVMPLTMDYLRSELGAAIFEHHTVLGLSSLPNACGFLGGSRLEDLPPAKVGRLVDSPFIWKEFSRRGYVTAFMEDWTLTFTDNVRNYAKVEQPTDHIGIMFAYYIKKLRSARCVEKQPLHEYYLNLPEAMWSTYSKNEPKFYLGWFNQYSHQDATQVAYMDSPLMKMLQSMHHKGHLDNTVTIIMGDHGGRFQKKFRSTEEGRHDHRTPLLAIVPPLSWEDRSKGSHSAAYANLPWENLWLNTKKLTSQFDLHATLWEILGSVPGFPPLPDHRAQFYKGQSLFSPDLSWNRTCKEAGIPTIYCPYINWTNSALLPPSLNATYLGQQFVAFINSYQEDYFLKSGLAAAGDEIRPCKERVLQKTRNGGILTVGRFFLEVVLNEGSARAEFEVSGTYEGEKVNFAIQDVDRVDRFGDPPACLNTFPESIEKKFMDMLCVC